MGQTALGVVSYAHLAGLPLVPVAKQALTECPFCQRAVHALGHSSEVDEAVRRRVFGTRALLPSCVGALLLAATAVGLIYMLRHARTTGHAAALEPVSGIAAPQAAHPISAG